MDESTGAATPVTVHEALPPALVEVRVTADVTLQGPHWAAEGDRVMVRRAGMLLFRAFIEVCPGVVAQPGGVCRPQRHQHGCGLARTMVRPGHLRASSVERPFAGGPGARYA